MYICSSVELIDFQKWPFRPTGIKAAGFSCPCCLTFACIAMIVLHLRASDCFFQWDSYCTWTQTEPTWRVLAVDSNRKRLKPTIQLVWAHEEISDAKQAQTQTYCRCFDREKGFTACVNPHPPLDSSIAALHLFSNDASTLGDISMNYTNIGSTCFCDQLTGSPWCANKSRCSFITGSTKEPPASPANRLLIYPCSSKLLSVPCSTTRPYLSSTRVGWYSPP